MKHEEIENYVYQYPTKYKEGFLPYEIEKIYKEFNEKYTHMIRDKFDSAMMGNTCIMKEGTLCMYHCDILKAIICAIENRELTYLEWD